MSKLDASAIAAVGVLAAALVVLLGGFGVVVPLWLPAAATIACAVAIAGLRVYVATVGADATSVDERLDRIERVVIDLREIAKPSEEENDK